ncbi:lysophospholipase L1-like esterase [Anseongella ginsenosidimutans]|uniref:Lysophospholipase L1-like esterase n=1 Tax=Anseongella ginsenosidimutans TaxID=496056 RepID=A0A4R3KJY9_9SPHI|nr:GDSL-type esterase/lipase family protein [Anseongella ginsenosidimutans]QEC52790.1 hypothetical protein FRZ59_10870 [Anseongella ginsenosidimutans]TCS83870.1 lysophospholipase L1-like esterase [Anseongella ginsenosidimutans]
MQLAYFKKVLLFALTGLLSAVADGHGLQGLRGSHTLTESSLTTTFREPIANDTNHLKIVYFGSSVPAGQGATNHKGYTSLFSDILKNRASEGGNVWETANISIGGDNTIRVLKRYETDLLPQKGDYVVFALALGNEGIHERGQPVFDQFERNMKVLIKKARADGYVPVVTNNYTRNDYNEKDYRFIKQMNILIHGWDVPSINLLGAIDDLSGHWVDGFWDDGFHPNDAGHAEMSYTIVPSLFEALESGKPMPKKVEGSYIRLTKRRSEGKYLTFKPEHIVHPFTTAISFKTSGPGVLLRMEDVDGTGVVSVNDKGRLVYSSAKSGVITGTGKVDDGQWHKVIVSHYYAKGLTMLYCDSTLQGTVEERLVTTGVKIGGAGIPKKLAYKDWLFYRSGMNQDEISCLAKDALLKSSLELYAPLDGKGVSVSDPLVNLAQSMNVIREVSRR